jgi:hypothetical protein
MSQRHFRDDPIMGKCIEIDGKPWTVTDVWADIGASDDAPRSVTLRYVDEEGDDEDHFSLPRDDVERMPAIEAKP